MIHIKNPFDFDRVKIVWANLRMHIANIPECFRKKRLEALDELFDTDKIALKNELASSWEFLFVWLRSKLFPKYSREDANSLVDQISKIGFMNRTITENDNKELYKIDSSFVRYHSLISSYTSIRLFFVLIVWMVVSSVVLIPLAYLVGVFAFFGGLAVEPEPNSVGIQFTAPSNGDYFLLSKSQGQDVNSYRVGILSDDSSLTNASSKHGMITPIDFGQEVFATLNYGTVQDIYETQGLLGQTIYLEPSPVFTDVDIEYQILNPDMSGCSEDVIIRQDNNNKIPAIICLIRQEQPYYIKVNLVGQLLLTVNGHYSFNVVSWAKGQEPNDTMAESSKMNIGSIVVADVSASDQDWYQFTANKGEKLTLIAFPTNTNTFSLTLYIQTAGGVQALAYSNQAVSLRNASSERLLDSSRGRAVFYSVLLQPFGIHPSNEWLVKNDLQMVITVELVFMLVIFFLIRGIFAIDWLFSPRRYNNSLIVKWLVEILGKLDDETILNSESKKARFRETVRHIAGLIPSLQGISRWPPTRAPRAVKSFFDGIAAQILETNEIISVPNKSTLDELRSKYINWLNLFMKEEYGSIDVYDIKHRKLPWYQPIATLIQRHWFSGLVVVFLVFLAMAIISQQNPQVAESIFNYVWLICRYILLVGIVMVIYLQWGGLTDANDSPASKWKNAAKFILFFLLPFIILDSLLKTGFVSTLIALAGSIKNILG